jgi:hypothetical protein
VLKKIYAKVIGKTTQGIDNIPRNVSELNLETRSIVLEMKTDLV